MCGWHRKLGFGTTGKCCRSLFNAEHAFREAQVKRGNADVMAAKDQMRCSRRVLA